MPKRKNVTYEAFEQVANELLGSGTQPTVRAVGDRIGGSNTTLLRHQDKWNELRAVPAPPPDLPPEMVAAVRVALDRSVAKARSEEQAHTVELRNVLDDMAVENESLQDQLEDLSTQCSALATERDALKDHCAKQATKLSILDELAKREQAAAESARVDVAKVKLLAEAADASRIAHELRERDLRTELKAANESIMSLRSEKGSIECAAAVYAAQLEAERHAHALTQTRTAELAHEIQALGNVATRFAAAEAANAELRAQLKTLQAFVSKFDVSRLISPPAVGREVPPDKSQLDGKGGSTVAHQVAGG